MSKESKHYDMSDPGLLIVKGLVYEETLLGDKSFAGLTLHYLLNKLNDLEAFDPDDINALLIILDRIASSKKAISIICGDAKGHPKKGRESLQTAMRVFEKIQIERLSVNEAWELTAKEPGVHKSPRTVEKHWAKWKGKIYKAANHSLEASK